MIYVLLHLPEWKDVKGSLTRCDVSSWIYLWIKGSISCPSDGDRLSTGEGTDYGYATLYSANFRVSSVKHCQGDRPSSGHRGLLWSHACVWLMHVGRGETTNPRMMAGGQLRRVGGTGMIIAHALGEGTPFVSRIVGRVWRAWGPRLEMGVAHVPASMAGRRSHGEACSIPPTKYGKEVSVERLASPLHAFK